MGISAVELLKNPRERKRSTLTKLAPTIFGLTGGVLAAMMSNQIKGLPMLSSPKTYAKLVLFSLLIFFGIQRSRMNYRIKSDAILVEYLNLHPEDFEETEKKTYSQLFQTWHPIR